MTANRLCRLARWKARALALAMLLTLPVWSALARAMRLGTWRECTVGFARELMDALKTGEL